MTQPTVPLRFEHELVVPGTPDEVWAAIATAAGISSWMMPTELEERLGGTVVFHMGDEDSRGTITGWEPPFRVAYEEPDWDTLGGQAGGTPVTPLVTEFLVEAQSGGTCLVRVVSSAFGTGADWERESMAGMEFGWRPMLDNLIVYLTHFRGQHGTPMDAMTTVEGAAPEVWTSLRSELGLHEVGQAVEARGIKGEVDRLGDGNALVRLTAPLPGYFTFWVHDMGGETVAGMAGYLFSDEASDYIEREHTAWQTWLTSLGS